jgi:rubredoxin---NAD+ reductase
MRYVCLQCGHIYDEEEGQPDDGIPQGTAFPDLPDDWACPFCGAAKNHSEREEAE